MPDIHRVDDATTLSVPAVDIPPDAWEDVSSSTGGAPRTNLLATVAINGVLFHVEAIAVRPDETSEELQAAADEANAADLDRLWELVGGSGPMATVTIAGRPYILFASPFED